MASSHTSSPKPLLDLELTVVSAKHLKNVNWRHGDLKPYAVCYLYPDGKLATKPDDAGSTRPVWNERFVLPVTLPLQDSVLTLEVFHSKPSETPKPLVGTLRIPLKDLLDSGDSSIKSLELRRPSGRPQGKIRIKVAVRERPAPPPRDYHSTPPSGFYYSSGLPLPPAAVTRDYAAYSPAPYGSISYGNPLPPPPPAPQSQYPYGSYADPYYYSGYYSQSPPPPTRPYYDRPTGYGRPSAPVDYSAPSGSVYDQRQKGNKVGMGTGLAIGAVAGALGGLALDEGLKYEEEKIAERVENDPTARDDYSDYREGY